MTRKFYQHLKESGEPMEILPIKRFILRGAFSERGSAIKVNVIFQCDDNSYAHEFYVVEKLAFDVVLGINFLTKYQMHMKCGDEIEIKFQKNLEPVPEINAIRREDCMKYYIRIEKSSVQKLDA